MTKKPHPIKKRLSREILGILVLSLVLTMVLFSFLCSGATLIIDHVIADRGIVWTNCRTCSWAASYSM